MGAEPINDLPEVWHCPEWGLAVEFSQSDRPVQFFAENAACDLYPE